MASRTTRRNTFSVSADNDDFNINYYNQAEFKGLNTSKNDIAVDPASFADAENVNDWQNTLSPFLTLASFIARCIAAEPEESAAIDLTPQIVFNSSSKPVTFAPNGAIQFVSKASLIYFFS